MDAPVKNTLISRERMDRDMRSPLILLAAALFTGAAIFALAGLPRLGDVKEISYLLAIMELKYIDAGASVSWLLVRSLVLVLAVLVPAVMAVGLWLTAAATLGKKGGKMPLWGVDYFRRAGRILRGVLLGMSVLLALLYIFRFGRYLAIHVPQVGGFVFTFAMLLAELPLGFVVFLVMLISIRGTDALLLALENLRLVLLTGRAEIYGMKWDSARLLLLTGCAAVVLVFLMGDTAPARAAFALSAGGHFLLWAWYLWYRRQLSLRAVEQYREEKNRV